MRILAIMTMGALGALARYEMSLLISTWMARRESTFPLATLVVNVLGSFLLAVLVTLVAQKIVSDEWRFALGIGFLGAFTTFSTFAVEAEELAQRGEWTHAAFYIGGNLVLGIAAVVAGRMLALSWVR
jgi:fluoride exporter